nr:hypothetical protein [Rhodococcus sp. 06-418-1B]
MATRRAIATGSAMPSFAWLAYVNPSVALALAALFVGLLSFLIVGVLSLLFCPSSEAHRRARELICASRMNPGFPVAGPGNTACVGCRNAGASRGLWRRT